jgi:ribosomal protein S18 acetylase RimI-like enzyme
VGRPSGIEIVDVVDEEGFVRLPPCADARFDHRSCDYWEDEVAGSKAARPSWWRPAAPRPAAPAARPLADNPFAPAPGHGLESNPFAPPPSGAGLGPGADPASNPFAPAPKVQPERGAELPRKLRLLLRGEAVFGTYAKVVTEDAAPVAYAQFGPLSAYPRAQRIRELYPSLPQAPLPAVITCIATTASARRRGLALRLVDAVRQDLAARGFAALESYPDLTLGLDEASAAHPRFWERCGFVLAVDDERYPVMRLELA